MPDIRNAFFSFVNNRRRILARPIRLVLDEEFPELWTEFLPRSLSLFTSSDQKQIQVGAELLLFLYKKYRFTEINQ